MVCEQMCARGKSMALGVQGEKVAATRNGKGKILPLDLS